MRRALVLGALVAVGAFSAVIAASQQPTEKPKLIEVDKLRDNLFVLRGGGGNTGVFITSTGVVVVDSKNPGWGQTLLDKIKEITTKPVTHLINTHTHFDHVSGNVEFPTTVEIIAHETTAVLMKEMRTVTGMAPQKGNIFSENKGRGLPKRTFKDTLTIGKGADQVDLHYFGRGHTGGDAWVVFPALRVVHAGDIFPAKAIPILDANNGGSGVEMGETLSKAAAGLKNVETIITGHSTQMTPADLREWAEFNRDFANAVRDGKKAGRSIDEIANSWTIPAKYKGYAQPQAARLRVNVEVVYNEIK
jgi:glyoxylase-like metal-dependent hydrolase (beta-lactamase superfamily II)